MLCKEAEKITFDLHIMAYTCRYDKITEDWKVPGHEPTTDLDKGVMAVILDKAWTLTTIMYAQFSQSL